MSELVTMEQLSEYTGKTYRTLKKRIQGLPPTEQRGNKKLYDSRIALILIYYAENNKEK